MNFRKEQTSIDIETYVNTSSTKAACLLPKSASTMKSFSDFECIEKKRGEDNGVNSIENGGDKEVKVLLCMRGFGCRDN